MWKLNGELTLTIPKHHVLVHRELGTDQGMRLSVHHVLFAGS